MPENITLEQLQTAQNTHFAAQTADMNELKENTAAVLSTLSELANRVYDYSHDATVAKDLEAVYADIIEDSPELAELSAVGFTALLKDGNKIETQGNICYINGTQEETDYTFSGENSEGGFEVCTVWYFENDDVLSLSSEADFAVIGINIINRSALPTIDASYIKFATEMETDAFTTSSVFGGRSLKENGLSSRSSVSAGGNLTGYFSDMAYFGKNFSGFADNKELTHVELPECICLGGLSTSNITNTWTDRKSMFMGCSNPQLEIIMPQVEYILGAADNIGMGIFDYMYKVKIPSRVKTITRRICSHNTIIELECNDADSISNNWCFTAPEIFRMADDWGASINIAVAAANWDTTDFVDLFTDNLRDMDDEVHEIKIPSGIYDSLTDDEFALAEDKNWTVGA